MTGGLLHCLTAEVVVAGENVVLTAGEVAPVEDGVETEGADLEVRLAAGIDAVLCEVVEAGAEDEALQALETRAVNINIAHKNFFIAILINSLCLTRRYTSSNAKYYTG